LLETSCIQRDVGNENSSIHRVNLSRILPPLLPDDADSQFPKRRILKKLTTLDSIEIILMFMTTHHCQNL
jgi:hypothetical protein